jgi:hypothetical protein
VVFTPADRAFLAALLRPVRSILRRLRLGVRPDTVLHWQRNWRRDDRQPDPIRAAHPSTSDLGDARPHNPIARPAAEILRHSEPASGPAPAARVLRGLTYGQALTATP